MERSDKPQPDRLGPEGADKQLAPDFLISPEALAEMAREYFAIDFPNPERIGCPAPGTIQETARAGQLPSVEMRAHVFSCSECFREYRSVMLSRSSVVAKPAGWWRDFIAPWRQLRAPLIASACALMLSTGAWFIWRSYQEAAPQTKPNGSQPAPAISALPTLQAQSTPPASASASQAQPPASAGWLALKLDLNAYPPLGGLNRGGTDREELKTIKLPQARLQLELTLPSGSAPGHYRVSLADAFDKPLAHSTAFSPAGNRLTVLLDLRRLSQQTYRLCLRRGDEAPDYYQVEVTKQ